MRLAVASGKGGTGKTTVATNLAVTLARHGQTVAYVDCDVEAPNGHLFLNPTPARESLVGTLVPRVDQERCLLCGLCAQICRFNAIVCLPDQVLVYDELCHSCGGCVQVCPAGAITEVSHPMGVVKSGAAGAVQFVSGTLNVGEATSPPVIRAAKQAASPAQWTILDAPPGTACPMIETVRDCDYVLLVTEPTPFGLHDLRLAVEVARTLKLACGVVVNRADPVATETREWCEHARVAILAEIPDSVAIAKAYSQGQLIVEAVPGLQQIFDQLIARLLAEVPPHE
jgi:MinD superfamily P-loop ATPase